MSREITNGFDLAAQLNEDTLARVFAFLFTKRIRRVQRTISEDRGLEIWFDRPIFSLVSSGDPAANVAEIELRMTARLSDKLDEARLFMKARGRLELPRVQAGAKSFLGPSLDFKRSRDSDFALTFSGDPDFDDVVLTTMRDTLRQESPFLVSPLIPVGPTVELRTYFNLNGTNLMALFATIIGGAPPAPPTVVRRTTQERPVVILVPDDLVLGRLQSGLAAAGLGSLPARVPGRPDVELRSVDIQLANGHVVASGAGTGTKEIVTEVKVDFSFRAFLQLLIDGNRFTTHLISAQQQINSALGDLLDFLTTGVITRALEVAVEQAVSSIFGGTIPNAEVFADGLPSDEPVANAANEGIVRIFRNGLAIPVVVNAPLATPAEPPYLRGHKGSREFHVTKGCEFGDLIAPRNLKKFTREEQAVRDGYDGCSKCMTRFDVQEFGDLVFTVKRPAGAPTGPVTITATLESEVVRFDIPVTPPPETVVATRSFVDRTDGVQTLREGFSKIVPGTWSVSFECPPWSVTGLVTVGERFIDADAKLHGTSTEVTAIVGQPGFQVA